MAENPPPGYSSLAAYRRSTLAKLRNEATQRRRPADQLHREYLLQRFLARVFHDSNSPWVLKGGAGLLIRLPGARHSKDLDLLHPEHELAEAIAELRVLSELDLGDYLTWNVDSKSVSDGTAAKLKITAYMEAAVFGDFFSLDASLTVLAIRSEEQRRQITLPTVLHSPSPAWKRGYRDLARNTMLEEALHDLDTALRVVGECLNPLLAGTVTTGRWQPAAQAWTPGE